jgi:oligoribonuclease NrnB/cAMP/cGMP phosphodiesterase (DHH superfamily)
MQGRVRLKLTIEGPVGGAKKRLLECIRDAGYNVSEPTSIVGSHKDSGDRHGAARRGAMKPLVIYHKNCMDGAGAAFAAWLKFGEEAEYRPASYGDPAPTDAEVAGRDVYIVDFSYPRAELVRMFKAIRGPGGTIFQVLDHHKTAQKDLEDLSFCTFDMSMCGARMAWRYFTHSEQPTPELFQYIEDRDLWQWQLPHSKEISAALFARGCSTDFKKLASIHDYWHHGQHEDLIAEGSAILRAEAQMIDRIVSTAEEVTIDGHRALAACSSVLQSEVGEALAHESFKRGGAAIGAIYYKDGKAGMWRVSLRSRDCTTTNDFPSGDMWITAPDVSAIAKKHNNGGGHHRAAGFECARPPWDPDTDRLIASTGALEFAREGLQRAAHSNDEGFCMSCGLFPCAASCEIGIGLASVEKVIGE